MTELSHEMNDGLDMPEGVRVKNVWTNFDCIVTPPGKVFKLRDGNVGDQYAVQDVCRGRWVGHFGLVNDRVMLRIADAALDDRKPRWGWDCFSPLFVL